MIAERIGQFEIKHLLGSGGFGEVFAAIDTELGRWVAIKALRAEIGSNPALVERFRAEGISLARLNHTNITTLYALQRHGQNLFLVMELVEGITLDKLLARRRRLELTEVRAIIDKAAQGLAYAHKSQVIHRDIKPSNLMLTKAGDIKIMDFGIARIRGTQRMTREGLLGTYAYLAPEQFRGGEGSERSDLYSLACVTYEMLSGRIPFDAGSEAEMMRGHIELPPPFLRESLPAIDPTVDAALQRALSKHPGDRFATVTDFASAIGCDGTPTETLEVLALQSREDFDPHHTRITDPVGFSQLQSQYPEPISAGHSSPEPRRTARTRVPWVLAPVVALPIIGAATYFMVTTPMGSPGGAFSTETSAVELSRTKPAAAISVAPAPLAEDADSRLSSAEQLLRANRAGEAESMLISLSHKNFRPAMVRLARLYNPMLQARPPGFEPSAARSARYYRDALANAGENSDPQVRHERDALRDYLTTQSLNGDTDATITLKTFMQ